VDLLELLDVRLVGVNRLLVLLEAVQLVLEGALHAHADGRDGVHLPLDPRPDLVRLLGELPPEHLVVLLLAQLGLQGGVTLRHQLPHLSPLFVQVLRATPSITHPRSAPLSERPLQSSGTSFTLNFFNQLIHTK